ncbi:MAG: hypothetical protein MSH49_00435 [[Eubacterium] saphenum]|nr:hypothetical protein [[Eubacterium] saphenum]
MRVTNSVIMRGFNRDLNRVGSLKNDTMHRITSTRKFNRASEAPLSAAKALNVRKSLYFSAQYKENLKVADSFYTEAETSLLQVSEKLASVRETIIAAVNTTKSIDEYNIYAQQLERHAEELCAVFNTDTAGRAIFGGESDDGSPFTIEKDANGNASTVLYHGVPLNAMNDPKAFPYSNVVVGDIGLGIDVDQQTQAIDEQSALRISFNGSEVSGCGAERGVADIDLTTIKAGRKYCIDVFADNVKKTITFYGSAESDPDLARAENLKNIQAELDEAFKKSDEIPIIDNQGVISLTNGGIVCAVNNKFAERTQQLGLDNDSGYTKKYKLDVENLVPGKEYSVNVTIGDETRTVVFAAGDDLDPDKADEASLHNLQYALTEAFKDTDYKPNVSFTEANKGVITCEGETVKVLSDTKTTIDSSFLKDGNVINAKGLEAGKEYTFVLGVGFLSKECKFTATGVEADDFDLIKNQIIAAIPPSLAGSANIDANGKVTLNQPTTFTVSNTTGNAFNTTTKKLDMTNVDNKKYEVTINVGTTSKTIKFNGVKDDISSTIENLNAALKREFVNTNYDVTYTEADGIKASTKALSIYSTTKSTEEGTSDENPIEMEKIYSANYIQLTLDAAKALRNGDIGYANGCIDRIVSANEKLLVEIANLGCNEDFISFNIDRLTTREYNSLERQNDLESANLEEETTLLKTYSALYNACLQMASEVVPNSIFNYMK